MAALKVIVIALLATFAVQGVAAGDSFETSINNLSNLLENAITGLTNTLGEVVDKVSDVANKTVSSVEGHVDGLFSQIENLQKKAAAQGKNISECAAPNKAIIAATRENAGAAARACGHAGVEAAKAALRDGKAQLPDLKLKIADLVKDWDNCTAWNFICYAKVIAKVGSETLKAGVQIGAVTTKVALQFPPIIYHAGNCTASIFPDVTRNTTTIMKNVFECTKNTIG